MNQILEQLAADTARIRALQSGRAEAEAGLRSVAETLGNLSSLWKLLPESVRTRLAPYLPGREA